ncbi:MlaA family lipoprotein [Anaerohalosphaeraceae bacterium U12dextr]
MKWTLLIVLVCILIAGCATTPKNNSAAAAVVPAESDSVEAGDTDFAEFDTFDQELSSKTVKVADPLESWNRLMFNTNDVLYFWVLKPVGQGYKAVVPEPGRIGIRNVFQNITTPVRLVNCLLQGKFHSAGNEVNRFVINTTWGVLGIWDPALEKGKIEPADEDFGQTLAVYGLGDGCYLVWPLFGPSTLRDSAGMAGDYFLNPTVYIEDSKARVGVSAVNIINKTSFRIGEYEQFKAASLAPYVAMREVYIQYRNKQIQDQPKQQQEATPPVGQQSLSSN